jgi:hypothetical protein
MTNSLGLILLSGSTNAVRLFRAANGNDRLKNLLRSVGCFLSNGIGFSPFGIVPQLLNFALLLRLQLGERTDLSLVRWLLDVCNRRQILRHNRCAHRFVGRSYIWEIRRESAA